MPLGPGERTVGLVALLQLMTCPHAVALDAERKVGLKPDRELPASRVGGVPVVADQRPVRRGTAVVEVRLADQLELEIPIQAKDRANSMWSASSSTGGRVCGVIRSSPCCGPIVRASRTRAQPVGVFQVVAKTFVPGS